MICEHCDCKSECGYYSENIEPVLNTEQSRFTNDVYLRTLSKVLEAFGCDDFEPQKDNGEQKQGSEEDG